MELYNRAYRLDPEIDRNIDHDSVAAEISQKDLSEIEPYYNPFRKLMIQNDPVDKDLYLQISKSQSQINPQPDEEIKKGVFKLVIKEEKNLLADLPADVFDKILEYLGLMHLPSLETVSTASRNLFLACRQDSLWKELCGHMEGCKRETRLLDDSWRMQYIMRPTFRTDGIYISKITYFRQGYQESAISQPSHLVTYYRYLRFFNGPATGGKRIVTALVSTEKPRQVIETLKELDEKTMKSIKERFFNTKKHQTSSSKSSHKRKNDKRDSSLNISTKPNLFIGTYWRQDRPDSDRLFSLILFDAHSKNPMRLKMTMEMADPLKGAPAYRTAKCTEYIGKVSVTDVDEDVSEELIDFDTHNWGKFYFSRVKSYI